MDKDFAEQTTIRATHIIEEVNPKEGVYNIYHDQVRGKPCVIFELSVDHPGLMSVAMDADPSRLHMFHTSTILKIEKEGGVTTVETLNTVYKFRLMNEEEQQDDTYVYPLDFFTGRWLEMHGQITE